MTLHIGMTASRTRMITDEDIRAFAQATGDTNSIHLDDEAAAASVFGRRVAHGMLTAGVISAILGNDLPGPGTIYLGQDMKFKAPVFIGDTVTATVELTQYREDRRIATFHTTVTNQDGVLILVGDAVVLAPAQT